jgi:hypothetical protein
MQKHNHIKAFFFLGVFSMLLLHQVVPHRHHQHDVEHTHKAVAHSDNHSHHHDVPENESPKKGFLDLFFEMHVHSMLSNEILLKHESSIKLFEVKKLISTSISVNQYSIYKNYDEAEKVTVYHPPNTYFKTYLSSFDSRGPPSLG